ncbi:MAG TPA: DinB family protein [Taishania sp.]|nr:DinB family protein [Taishania sp.]
MTTESLFHELETITNSTISFLENDLSKLSSNQLNWKPRSTMWNINEVIAHLNEFAKYYHSAFSKKIDTTIYRSPRETFLSSPLGKSMWSSMKLGALNNVKRKMKAQRMYDPLIVTSIVSDNILVDFLASQKDLINILNRAKTINIRKAKITILNTMVVKFRFGDALLYVIYHNQRHIQQIKNLMNHPNFPKQ